MIRYVSERVENIVEKEVNAGHQHFLLFPQCFPKVLSTASLKFCSEGLKVNCSYE